MWQPVADAAAAVVVVVPLDWMACQLTHGGSHCLVQFAGCNIHTIQTTSYVSPSVVPPTCY